MATVIVGINSHVSPRPQLNASVMRLDAMSPSGRALPRGLASHWPDHNPMLQPPSGLMAAAMAVFRVVLVVVAAEIVSTFRCLGPRP